MFINNTVLTYNKFKKFALECNNLFSLFSVPEIDRCKLTALCLVALKNKNFLTCYKDKENHLDLLDFVIFTFNKELEKSVNIHDEKGATLKDILVSSSHSLYQILDLTSNVCIEIKNSLIYKLIEFLKEHFNLSSLEDLNMLYSFFHKYGGGGNKTGVVFTPLHITDLCVELLDIRSDDVVFDGGFGLGNFFISFLNKYKDGSFVGIEKRKDLFFLSCLNFIYLDKNINNLYNNDFFTISNFTEFSGFPIKKSFLNPPYDNGPAQQLTFLLHNLNNMEVGGKCVAICQISTVLSVKNDVKESKKLLLNNHRLDAVFSLPDDTFYPVGVSTVLIICTAGIPHNSTEPTFFGYFKKDGLTNKAKGTRLDTDNKWKYYKNLYLDLYRNLKIVSDLSFLKKVSYTDEWLPEAHLDIDYTQLTEDHFKQTVKDYLIYKFKYLD